MLTLLLLYNSSFAFLYRPLYILRLQFFYKNYLSKEIILEIFIQTKMTFSKIQPSFLFYKFNQPP